MTDESSWRDLAEELAKVTQTAGQLRADWLAYVGSEDYGIWLFRLDNRGADKVCAAFGLIAARVIEKLGVLPIPTPQPLQHCPPWRQYCDEREEQGRLEGKATDFSGAVPLGLGVVDWDAIDPCTRACLELLRRNSGVFRSSGSGSSTIKGREYPSLSGTIPDVCGALSEYCLRRARNEIASRLTNPTSPTGRTVALTIADAPKPPDKDSYGSGTLVQSKTTPTTEQKDWAALAASRRAVVMPILKSKRWTRGKWVTAAGVGKNSVYEYLDGKRRLSEHNRRALAEVMGLSPEQLPE